MSTTILYQFIPPTLLLLLLILATLATLVTPMRIHRPWTTKQWCSSVTSPAFPHAYSKHSLQTSEIKSRVSSSLQDNRHTCTVAGVQSRCHICEDIKCGDDLNQTCNYQLQGVAVGEMSVNIPSVTDIPFAVGGTHRYDYGGGSHVCLHLTADMCSDHTRTNPHTGVTDDYSDCELRCWVSWGIRTLRYYQGPCAATLRYCPRRFSSCTASPPALLLTPPTGPFVPPRFVRRPLRLRRHPLPHPRDVHLLPQL